jgi:two-component system, sensor histidine kinase PdtaS
LPSKPKPARKPTYEAFAEALIVHAARALDEDEFLSEAAHSLAEAAGGDGCHVFSVEPQGGLSLRGSTSSPEYVHRCRLGKGLGMVGHVATDREALFIRRHASKHPKSIFYPGIDEQRCEAVAVLPLHRGDEVCGVVMIYRERAWPFTAADKARLLRMAGLFGTSWEAFRNAFQLGSGARHMGALTEVSKTIAQSPYLEEILQLLVNITAQRFGYVVCTVRLLDERRGELVLRATQAPAKAYQRKRALQLGESIAGKAIAQNRPIIVPDVQVEADYVGHDLAVEQGLHSMICVPLTIQDRVVGVLTCYADTVREFTEDEISALETLAKQAAVSIEHARLQVRSTLMQEMHHRVKNSLQQVASLLRLQIRHGQEKSLEESLLDCLSRILAISSVHDLLSREDLDHVGIRQVAEALVSHQHSFIPPNRTVQFEVRGDEFRLNMMQATQVALILNELIQNATQHGFREATSGEIHVTVEEKDGEIGLWVSDSGDPLPEGFDPASESNLGLQIVDNSARGLGGKFTIEDRLGWTVAEVTFQRVGSE